MDCRTNGLSDQWTVGPAGWPRSGYICVCRLSESGVFHTLSWDNFSNTVDLSLVILWTFICLLPCVWSWNISFWFSGEDWREEFWEGLKFVAVFFKRYRLFLFIFSLDWVYDQNFLTLLPPNYSISIFTHLRSTTSRKWKLYRFDKMAVNFFQIMLVDVTFYL